MDTKSLFPIIRNVCYNHQHLVKQLDKGTLVRCRFCNKVFPLNERTVHMAPDEMQMVCCPACKRNVSVLYFFDNTVADEKNWIPVKKKTDDGRKKRMYVNSKLS